MNRLVVRNTFLDIDAEVCDDGDSDCLDTGSFARAATEPVSATGGLSGASSSTDAVAGLRGPGGNFAPAQRQALPEEEPIYVFSNDRFQIGCGSLAGQAPVQQPRPRGPQGGLVPPGLQANGGMGWPPASMPSSAPTAAALAAMAGMAPHHPSPTTMDVGRHAATEQAGDASWPGDPLDVGVAAQAASTIGPEIAEQATLIAIRDMEVSVTLGDPSLPDCPLIGCSDGFEKLTGYSRAEIVGQNCRFLNKGMRMNSDLRARLRDASTNGAEFIGVIPNMRKSGKRFQNLLHMTTLLVKGKQYVIGVQADASHISIDPRNAGHRQAIDATAERIFAGNIDAWIQMQAREFSMRLSTPFSQLLKFGSPARFAEEQGTLVKIGNDAVQGHEKEVVGNSIFSRATTASDERPRSPGRSRMLPASDGRPPPTGEAPSTASRLGLKSLGSVKHPNDCVECCFHFFSPSGCRAAENCDFCHEFHPRKNAKKNRRLIKRLANAETPQEQVAPKTATLPFATAEALEPCSALQRLTSATEQCPTFSPTDSAEGALEQTNLPSSAPPPQGGRAEGALVLEAAPRTMQPQLGPAVPELKGSAVVAAPQHLRPATPRVPMAECRNSEAPGAVTARKQQQPRASIAPPLRESSEMMRLCYFAEVDGEAPTATLLYGVDTMLVPNLIFSTEESQRGLKGCLTFVAEPPLPLGLKLDPRSGSISGIPEATQPTRSHLITVKTLALGPGGVALGEVPLTRCVLNFRVLSPSQVTLCSNLMTQSEGASSGADDSNFVTLTFEAQGSPT